jgi:predicted TIM-barrel fold metal-dependent hydrolase
MTPEAVGKLDPRQGAPINPGAWDPQARLKDMDAMGIGRALLFPTAFAEYFPVVENPDVAAALARAYNDWAADFAKAAPDRLYPAGVLPMQDTGFAIAAAIRAAGKGFKAVSIRPSFFNGKYISHPMYGPLWKTLESLNLAAFVHASPGSANEEWASHGPFVERVAASVMAGHNIAEAVAPIMDDATALTAFAFFGHMEEYPKLRLAFAHSGAAWLTLALEKAETYISLLSNIRDVSLEPEHVFFERPSLVTWDAWESSVARQPDVYGSVAAWCSHYPQHDTATVQEAKATLGKYGVAGDVAKGILGGNLAKFMGV